MNRQGVRREKEKLKQKASAYVDQLSVAEREIMCDDMYMSENDSVLATRKEERNIISI